MGCPIQRLPCLSLAATLLLVAAHSALSGEPAKPGGLGDPGTLTALTIGPDLGDQGIMIHGRHARQQLFVTGVYASDQLRDLTNSVTYVAEPPDVVSIDSTGLITPLSDGHTLIRTVSGNLSAEISVHVEGFAEPRPINFKNQIVPIFTKLGCSGGGCHGKASGQNGFRLSLLGFYPDDDYEFLVKESRGRRLFPCSPGESLILQKALGHMHGGGQRMELGSYEYRLICQWIEQSMPYGGEKDPTLVAIKCLPEGRVLDRGAAQQITTMAMYSDGSTEDVTRMALYEANDSEMAEVASGGVVTTRDRIGEVAIMAALPGSSFDLRADHSAGSRHKQHAGGAKSDR